MAARLSLLTRHTFSMRKFFGSFSRGEFFDKVSFEKEYRFFMKNVKTFEDTIVFKLLLIEKYGEKKANDFILRMIDIVEMKIHDAQSPLNPEDPKDL